MREVDSARSGEDGGSEKVNPLYQLYLCADCSYAVTPSVSFADSSLI